jgi:hypothetical protein
MQHLLHHLCTDYVPFLVLVVSDASCLPQMLHPTPQLHFLLELLHFCRILRPIFPVLSTQRPVAGLSTLSAGHLFLRDTGKTCPL